MGGLRATRGFPEGRGLRRGAAPGGGVGFWPLGPMGGDALMMGEEATVTVKNLGSSDVDGKRSFQGCLSRGGRSSIKRLPATKRVVGRR